MKKVPFFADTADGSQCLQASFRIMLKYFLPERNFSFEKLDQMSRRQSGEGTWWAPLLLEFAGQGLAVKDIEPFDYMAFYRSGNGYVRGFYSPEAAEFHLERTNLRSIKPLISDFLQKVAVERRPATLDDIDRLLSESWLAAAAVNSRALNNEAGFSGHVVVIFRADKDRFGLPDPGLPGRPNLQISRQKMVRSLAVSRAGNNRLGGCEKDLIQL